MARVEVDPNYSAPTFSRATAGTDLFKKEDVQALAAAVSTHDHSTGKGVALTAGAIPNGTITSAMIADGTIVAGDIADGAVTSAKILDGTIATVDLANGAVTNAKLAADTARDNLLTNGGFEVWQRGNGPFTVASTTTADRWVNSKQGTDTLSVSRDTSNGDGGVGSCAACTFTLGSGTTSSLVGIITLGTELTELRGRTVTLSVRVKTSTASAVKAFIQIDGSKTDGTIHTGGGVYQTLTCTVAVPAGAASLIYGVMFTATCTAYVDSAMLVVGSVAADYVPLHPADDLARCLRYYEVYGSNGSGFPGLSGYQAAGTNVGVPFMYRAQKPVTPTVTKNGTWTVSNCGQPSAFGADTNGFLYYATATALGSINIGPVANCTITVEANP